MVRAMNFELTEEQKLVQQMARDFATKEVAPVAGALDKEGRWPGDLVARMGELGLMGVAVPSEHGGAGLDNVSYAIAMEEVARACASTAVIMSVNNSLVCDPLLKFGNDAQKKEFLTPMASGEKLGCFGLTEPASGSDASNMATFAEEDGDDWILNGSKNWITNGPHADVMILFVATHDRSAGSKGTTALIVPSGTRPATTRSRVTTSSASTPRTPARCSSRTASIPKSQQLGDKPAWASRSR